MMNLVPKLITILVLLISCSYVQANSQFSRTTINGVIVHDFGNDIILELSSEVTNSEGCTSNNVLALKKTHPSFDEMYSAVLSAFHAGTSIQGWVNGCHQFNMPILTLLNLKK
jgi:hypothetical protein